MSISGLLVILSLAVPAQRSAAALPIVMLAPTTSPSHTLALLITGDGGWASTDRTIAERLARDGDGVIVLNSLHYFTYPRTPAGLAADLSTLARVGCARWSCDRIVLVGYSMGADVLPFVVDKLSSDVRPRVVQLQLISLSHEATFRFLPTQWLGLHLWPTVATLPQLAKLRRVQVVCIYGTSDLDAACRNLASGEANVIPLASGHVMSGVADQLAGLVSGQIRQLRR
jgi:type IV secretory pathway VirJ component